MNYRLILRQEAERDLDQAYNWYNEKVPGLGSDFLVIVERTLESIRLILPVSQLFIVRYNEHYCAGFLMGSFL